MQRRKWVIHPIADELCRGCPPPDTWALADWRNASGLESAADLAALIVRVEKITGLDYGTVLDEIEEI
jgi:hypothetical protein